MAEGDHPFAAIEQTFKRSVAALDAAEIPYLLGGSLAVWAHGGPETRNDLDFMLKADDAEAALEALEAVGMRGERPSEGWLLKARDGDVVVDLIHHPIGLEITDEVIARGVELDVAAMRVRVMAIEDVMVSKLLALGEHALDFEPSLQFLRALREKLDVPAVRARTADSPYARAFFSLAEELGVIGAGGRPAGGHSRVRVVR